MKRIFFFILLILSFSSLNSEEFKFKYSVGERARVECVINGKQFVNGAFFLSYLQEYKTVSCVKLFENSVATINESYFYYNKNNLADSEVRELKEDIEVSYLKDIQGRMTANNASVLPTLRNIPFFPEKDIKINEKWVSSGYEIQDLFGDKNNSIFPIEVDYIFLGYEEINGKKIAKINYKYDIDIKNSSQFQIDKRILSINGESDTILYFDNELGFRVKEIYKRDYIFEIIDGQSVKYVEFVDSGERNWYPVELMKKDDIVNDIKKDLEDNHIEDTEISKDEKGIKISLENIMFEPNSAHLLASEKERLNKISEILKKYKDRGVLVEGHTTDKGSEAGRQKLSLERAKSVVDFLIGKDAIDQEKSSYTGKGGSEPVAPNDAEEGMKKNRRVEIFILEE